MWRDLLAVGVVVALFALVGWLLPRCSLDLTRPPASTTTTDLLHALPFPTTPSGGVSAALGPSRTEDDHGQWAKLNLTPRG